MEMLLIFLVIAAGVGLLHFFTRNRTPKPGPWDIPKGFKPASSSTPCREPDELDRACYHDAPLVSRLVAFERERAPSISEPEARRRALERLYRDRAS
ncbi:hypothetical protein [Azoarcus olearius]|uniref:hypothetical protein n=1 Tax=Azoarcus sp. (strain BH72) TaxID=418699 RepID=UPI0012EE704F|nr:hypothetical protein [Azoarcus olearius]